MKKILLIFYGGTGLSDKKGNFKFVKEEKNIEEWLELVPELLMTAEIKTHVILGDHLNKKNITDLIKVIEKNISKFDGIVIIHEVDTIPLLSNQLFWQIQNPSKPIVITGSNVIQTEDSIIPDLSFKANLINAFQIVNTNLKKISVIYGNRVIAPFRVKRSKLHDLNIFKSVGKKYLAKIDFGLSLEKIDEQKGKMKFFYNFNDDFIFFNNIPDFTVLEKLLVKNSPVNIFIFRAFPDQIIKKDKLIEIFDLACKNKKMLIFYSEVGFGKDFLKHNIITISKITSDCLSAKLSWILGQTRDQNKIRKILQDNVQGEFLAF